MLLLLLGANIAIGYNSKQHRITCSLRSHVRNVKVFNLKTFQLFESAEMKIYCTFICVYIFNTHTQPQEQTYTLRVLGERKSTSYSIWRAPYASFVRRHFFWYAIYGHVAGCQPHITHSFASFLALNPRQRRHPTCVTNNVCSDLDKHF